MKLCILVAYKFLTKKINFGFSQCISGHVISQNMEFIRLATSQPFLKIETSVLEHMTLVWPHDLGLMLVEDYVYGYV